MIATKVGMPAGPTFLRGESQRAQGATQTNGSRLPGMKLLIVYYSHSGNNRLLAEHLGRILGARVEGVIEKRKRTGLTILLDMLLKRRPAIHAIEVSPKAFDRVLLAAPVWNMSVAYPMQTAIKQMRGDLGKFAFVSLCGYGRPGQSTYLAGELARLAGKAPEHVWELHVCDLVPPEHRDKVTVVSAHRVTENELQVFRATIEEIASFFR